MFGQASQGQLDKDLRRAVREAMPHITTHFEALPAYRFVDIYRAIESFCEKLDTVEVIDATHHAGLNQLLFDTPQRPNSYPRVPARRSNWKTGPNTELSLPRGPVLGGL